jgi:hypothetical protein
MDAEGTEEQRRLEGVFKMLLEAIERLADPAEQQIAWLQEVGTYPSADELALEFDDWFQLADQLVEAWIITPEAVDAMKPIDALLDEMSGPKPFWSPEALTHAPEWEQIREHARQVLALIPRSWQPSPNAAPVRFT